MMAGGSGSTDGSNIQLQFMLSPALSSALPLASGSGGTVNQSMPLGADPTVSMDNAAASSSNLLQIKGIRCPRESAFHIRLKLMLAYLTINGSDSSAPMTATCVLVLIFFR